MFNLNKQKIFLLQEAYKLIDAGEISFVCHAIERSIPKFLVFNFLHQLAARQLVDEVSNRINGCHTYLSYYVTYKSDIWNFLMLSPSEQNKILKSGRLDMINEMLCYWENNHE